VEEPFELAIAGGVLRGHRRRGEPPALLLHGGPALADYTAGCADLLDGLVGTIRYTQRGTPPSGGEPPFTIEAHMADAIAVLDSLEIERAWAIGHSWGGHLALHLAVAHPDRLLGLLCIGPLGAYADVQEEQQRNLTRGLTDEHKERIERAGQRRRDGIVTEAELVDRFALMWPQFFVKNESALPAPARIGVQCSIGSNKSIAEHFERRTLVLGLGAVDLPVLFVHGEGDALPPRSSLQTAALIPGAVVETIPDCGHFPWLEQPAAFRTAVERLLAA
jgi:proline iminopeptidase